MGKIFLYIALMLTTSLMANEARNAVIWAKDYKSGIEQATKLHKPVLFVISSNQCKYCMLLERTTLQDSKVIKALNSDFIAIRSWTNKRDYIPKDIANATPGLPGIWFLYSDGRPMYQPVLGYMDKDKMLEALGVVKTTFDKATKKSGK